MVSPFACFKTLDGKPVFGRLGPQGSGPFQVLLTDFWLSQPTWFGLAPEPVPEPDGKREARVFARSSRDPFLAGFEQTKARIARGELNKAVPFTVQLSPGQPTDQEISTWIDRVMAADQGFPYGWSTGLRGCIGVSPELLLELDERDRRLKTMALAGTVGAPDQWNPKLQLEHDFVVKGICEALGGDPILGGFEVVKAGPLWHGRTVIELADLENVDPMIWLERLHPTPALGLYPRGGGSEACRFLGERYSFGAPFVVREGAVTRAFVQIRGIEWDETGVSISAGAGVTAESTFESELEEVCAKFRSVLERFEISK